MQLDWQRIVLVMLAASVLSLAQVFEQALVKATNPIVAVELVIFGVIAFTFLWIALMRKPPQWTNSYVLSAALLSFIMFTLSVMSGIQYAADTPATVHYAARLLLDGKSPYVDFNIEECLRLFDLSPDIYGTRLMDGGLEQRFNYPAGSFLFLVPFVAAGLQDIRIVYFALLIAMTLIIHYYADVTLKNLIVLALLTNAVARVFAIGGMPEPMWALPLLLGWGWRDNRWRSAVAIGIAATVKQLAWFFVPYYAIMLLKEYGPREAVKRIGIVGIVFAVVNLPFVIQDPIIWLQSILGPVSDPMIPMGAGIVALGMSEVLPLWPKSMYLILEGAVFVCGVIWYFRRYPEGRAAAMVLATLPLWFAWRSLLSYFYLSGMLMIGVFIMEKAREAMRTCPESRIERVNVPTTAVPAASTEIHSQAREESIHEYVSRQ